MTKLQSTAGDMTFRLVVDPEDPDRDMAEQIQVWDGDFHVCTYCLDTLEALVGVTGRGGICVTSGRLEKHREIDEDALKTLCTEARAALDKARE